MKILVIGGTRFIGAALVHRLHEMGHEVAVFNRGQSSTPIPDAVQRITGDLEDLAASRDALQTFAPEIVVHNMVRYASQVEAMQAIFSGVARRFVMTSSMDVYKSYGILSGKEPGDVIMIPETEDDPVRSVPYPYRTDDMNEDHPVYYYDKIPAEKLTLNHSDLAGTVLRLPMVIGENDFQRRLLPFVKPMQDKREALVMDADYAAWQSTYGYVENVAAAMALATVDDRAIGRIYNVADGYYPTLTLAEKVKAVMNWQGGFVILPAEKLPESMHFDIDKPNQHLRVDASRIRHELDYVAPVDFDTAIERTVAWELANPPEEYPQQLANYDVEDAVLKALEDEQV